MLRGLFRALDRLAASVNRLADRFDAADAELQARLDAHPAPPQLGAAGAAVEGTASTPAEQEPGEAPRKGRKAAAA